MQTMSPLYIVYVVAEIIVGVIALFGNVLVILVFVKYEKTRKLTNYYILSLAIADLLVGVLGIPFALLTSIGQPHEFLACKFMLSLLVILCTTSIFNLLAVSIDRFWAILYPFSYKRLVTRKNVVRIIIACWILGTVIGLLPVFGWNGGWPSDSNCYFLQVVTYEYLVFLYFGTIVLPSCLMAFFYFRIYRIVLKQLRQIASMGHVECNNGKMASRKEVKTAKNLFVIVVVFIICWLPLYTINTVHAFCKRCRVPNSVTYFFIILSHANSSINPLLYAFYLRDFRVGIKKMFARKRFTTSKLTETGQIFSVQRGTSVLPPADGATLQGNEKREDFDDTTMQSSSSIYKHRITANPIATIRSYDNNGFQMTKVLEK